MEKGEVKHNSGDWTLERVGSIVGIDAESSYSSNISPQTNPDFFIYPKIRDEFSRIDELGGVMVAKFYRTIPFNKNSFEGLIKRNVPPEMLLPFQRGWMRILKGWRTRTNRLSSNEYLAKDELPPFLIYSLVEGGQTGRDLFANATLVFRLIQDYGNLLELPTSDIISQLRSHPTVPLGPEISNHIRFGAAMLVSNEMVSFLVDKALVKRNRLDEFYQRTTNLMAAVSTYMTYEESLSPVKRGPLTIVSFYPTELIKKYPPAVDFLPWLAFATARFISEIPVFLRDGQQILPTEMSGRMLMVAHIADEVLGSQGGNREVENSINTFGEVANLLLSIYREDHRLWDRIQHRDNVEVEVEGTVPSVARIRETIRLSGGRAPGHLNIKYKYSARRGKV